VSGKWNVPASHARKATLPAAREATPVLATTFPWQREPQIRELLLKARQQHQYASSTDLIDLTYHLRPAGATLSEMMEVAREFKLPSER
jgi:hypothetical protein